jgi:hypothetical protein
MPPETPSFETAPSAATNLLSAEAVRTRCGAVLEAALAGDLDHVAADLSRLPDTVGKTVAAIEAAYPDHQIPPFGCWRFFEADEVDRWAVLAGTRNFETPSAMLRSAADLAITSHCVSVPVNSAWEWSDPVTGRAYPGRTGLGLGILSMFAAGSFSADPADPMRVDAHALIRLEGAEVAYGLQLDWNRDGDTIKAIADLLKRLGEATGMRPDLFEVDNETRPGILADRLAVKSDGAPIDLSECLAELQNGLSPMWAGGAALGDVVLGDAFHHSALLQGEAGAGIVPFHLVPQEIAYALVEPFAWAGLETSALDSLTGLANLEHALLFLDAGAMSLKQGPGSVLEGQEALDRAIELRAVSVALMDRIADALRQELDAPSEALPLTCIMEGGTVRAGKKITSERPEFSARISEILAAGGVNWLPFGA